MLFECFVDSYEDFAKSYRKCGAWSVVLSIYLFITFTLMVGGAIGIVYINDLVSATIFAGGVVLMFPAMTYLAMVSIGYCLARAYSLPS